MKHSEPCYNRLLSLLGAKRQIDIRLRGGCVVGGRFRKTPVPALRSPE
jgi:hypothetical protein